MEGRFINEDNNSYIEIYPEVEGEIPPYITGMLRNNRIKGILDMHAQSVNNRIAYYYDTHGYESLKDIGSRENSGTDVILDILKCLDRTLVALDEYFLDRDGIVLEPQYIMWDSDSRKAGFVYVPGETTPVNVKLQHLFEYYMEHMQYGRREDTVRFYEAYQHTRRSNITIMELVDIIQGDPRDLHSSCVQAEECGKDGAAEEKAPDLKIGHSEHAPIKNTELINVNPGIVRCIAVIISVFIILSQVFSSRFPVRIPLISAIVLMAVPAAMYTMASRMGKETKAAKAVKAAKAAEAAGKTTPVNQHERQQQRQQHRQPDAVSEDVYATRKLCNAAVSNVTHVLELWHDDNPENGRIIIDRLPCVIGRHGMEADVFIDDAYVSRMHAQISIENEEVVVKDLYSGNGTYVNGRRLIPNEPERLNNGDVITFAASLYRVVNSNPI